MTFLEKLDRLLEQRHLNRSSLSAKAGIPYTTIDNWYKRGYEGLKLSTAGKLADFFGTTTDYFLRERIRPTRNTAKPRVSRWILKRWGKLQKYRALDLYGKRAVDGVLDAEYDRMTHIEREQRGWITDITCYDLAVSAGTGEPLGDTYYTTKLEIPLGNGCRTAPTAACGSAGTAWSPPTRTGTLCSFSGWKTASCGKAR